MHDVSPIQQLDTAAFDFPVEMLPLTSSIETSSPLKIGNMEVMPRNETLNIDIPHNMARAVIRTDTMEPLAVHGSRYQITPHTELFGKMNQMLIDSDLDLSDITVEDNLYENGARAKRTIIFNKHIIEPQVDDIVKLKLDMYNSYDGSWAWQSNFSAMRLWCLNGCTTADLTVRTYQRHTKNINIEGSAVKMNNAIEGFEQREGEFRHWITKAVNDDDVNTLFKSTIAHAPSPSDRLKVNATLADDLMGRYYKEKRLLGNNVWAVYNAATDWATHIGETKGKAHNVARTRETKVANMLNHNNFKLLAA